MCFSKARYLKHNKEKLKITQSAAFPLHKIKLTKEDREKREANKL